MVRGKKVYEPPSYMSVNTAIEQILEIIKDGDNCDKELLSEDTLCVGIARLGTEGQVIKSGERVGGPVWIFCEAFFEID